MCLFQTLNDALRFWNCPLQLSKLWRRPCFTKWLVILYSVYLLS